MNKYQLCEVINEEHVSYLSYNSMDEAEFNRLTLGDPQLGQTQTQVEPGK